MIKEKQDIAKLLIEMLKITKKLNKTFVKGIKANKLLPFSITILNNALL